MSTHYIRVVDGKTVGHPMTQVAVTYIDKNVNFETSMEFVPFTKVPYPTDITVGPYQLLKSIYVLDADGRSWKDNWQVVDMSPEDKQALIDAAKADKPFPSWTLNEELFQWETPVPKPSDGRRWQWNEEILSWVDITSPEMKLESVSFL